jgi:hypothetical protein
MIIQRITAAIRSQNWTNVIAEFLVVVLGIFVALQADNWNEARLDRKHERESLERLLREAENAVALIDRQIGVFTVRRQGNPDFRRPDLRETSDSSGLLSGGFLSVV